MQNKAIDKVLDIIRSNLHEQPTNNVGGGKIAGTVEAGDDPPVKKKKRYIYQKGLRKMWKPDDGRRS
jgi:hypothetical protein|tara:strand:- start:95 stop:295 length:201 start_codon:yes stop_codon:yes gene_type:complete